MYSCNQNTRDAEEGKRVQEKVINTSSTEVVLVVAIIPTLHSVEMVQISEALLSGVWSGFSHGLLVAG